MKNENTTNAIPTAAKSAPVVAKKGFLENFKVSHLATLMGLSLVGGIGTYVYEEQMILKNSQRTAYVEEMKVLGERLQKSSLAVRNADSKGFLELEITAKRLSKVMAVLKEGGVIDKDAVAIHVSKELAENKSLNDFEKVWDETQYFIETLLKQRNTMLDLKNVALSSLNGFNQMQSQSMLIVRGTESGTKAQQDAAKELSLLLNRVAFNINGLFNGNSFSLEDSYGIIKDLRAITRLIEALYNGNGMLGVEALNDETSQEALVKLRFLTRQLVSIDTAIKANTDSLMVAKDISNRIAKDTFLVEYVAGELGNVVKAEIATLNIWRIVSVLAFTLALVLAGLLSLMFYQRSLQALKMASVLEENQGNANAVNELLNQLKPINKGDFTQNVHVEDKFISPISTQVNKVRIRFNEIVRQMKGTSEQVLSSAEGTDKTSRRLLEISDEQFKKTSESITKLGRITSEIDELSQTTFIAQEESKESREASVKGSELVEESIKKMDSIRETIQESSKKIKRLGESAQAINEVTGLIQDITKQINVLALNAAIQAASTGEAGREFGIVAQEVQRLAEDSENATHKIATIISDIQKDASTAVASMEKTTQEVVAGAQLTDQAGYALRKIETLASSVAERVESASTDLEKKSEEMAEFALNMKKLQDITKESSDTIGVAAKQVEALKEIAGSLEQSVSTYKV